MEQNTLTRRQMVQRMALVIGGTLVAPTVLLESCNYDTTTSDAPTARLALLNAIAETIIPATDTPGAAAANTGAFIDIMIRDCYFPEDQEKLNSGIASIEAEAQNTLGKPFADCAQGDREALLAGLDQAAQEDHGHFFRTLKELTLLGYFTSEEALTAGVIQYEPVPTRYDGCAEATPETKIFMSKL